MPTMPTMPTPLLRRATLGLVLGLTLVPALPAAPALAEPVTGFEMPFACGQSWTGTTRSSHSPNPNSIDWNRPEDLGDPVVAAASGIVSVAESRSDRGYGHYVVLEHGNGEQTLYAHLEAVRVVVGQHVDAGTWVGTLGNTGHSTGPHLHFEQRQNGTTVHAYFHGERFRYGSTQASQNCPDTPVAGDFDGDLRSQLGLFRRWPRARFLVYRPGQPPLRGFFGWPLAQPVIGDWDGNGRANVGVRSVSGTFSLKTPGGVRTVTLGAASDQAVAGDWNGDGRWQVGVRRPRSAVFFLRRPNGEVRLVQLGDVDDLPVTGDWNGDRHTDVGVFDVRTAVWTLRYEAPDGTVRIERVQFGQPGDRPVVGDWDGNRRADLGTWSPGTGTFTKRQARSVSDPARRLRQVQFGAPR